MKKHFGLFLIAVGTTSQIAQANQEAQNLPDAVEGEYVLKNSSSGVFAQEHLNRQLSEKGMVVKEVLNDEEGIFLLNTADPVKAIGNSGISARMSKIEVRHRLMSNIEDTIETDYIEPNYIYHADTGAAPPTPPPTSGPAVNVLPNDTSFGSLWGLHNTGKNSGTTGADIEAAKAWNLTKGSKNIIVSVIDTGVNYKHPDLKGNMWSSPTDPNVHGYNAITGKLDPMDDGGHGTHVAGTIGAVGDNGIGVVGVNWEVSIMGCKFLGSNGSGALSNAIKCVDWSRQNGAKIINNSWGGSGYSVAMEDAIKRAYDAGILFLAAAGNDGRNTDNTKYYPQGYDVPNVISVAASTNRDALAGFSNYGVKTVDIMAPGSNILSTSYTGGYTTKSGTSMATPQVAGAAALLLSREPGLTVDQLKSRILSTGEILSAYKSKIGYGSRRLNVYNMLANKRP